MERVLFRNVQLLQGSHNDSLTNAVLIDGPRVEWIGSTREIPDTNIDKVIECDGALPLCEGCGTLICISWPMRRA